ALAMLSRSRERSRRASAWRKRSCRVRWRPFRPWQARCAKPAARDRMSSRHQPQRGAVGCPYARESTRRKCRLAWRVPRWLELSEADKRRIRRFWNGSRGDGLPFERSKRGAMRDDTGNDVGICHVDCHVESAGKAKGIRAAVALDHNAVEAKENSAIRGSGVELAAQRVQRPRSDDAAEAAEQRAAQGGPQIVHDEICRAFRRLQRNVASEAIGHDNINRAVGDVVAFDEAGELDRQRRIVAQNMRGPLHRIVALHVLRTDIEYSDRGPLQPQDRAGERLTHHGEIDELFV